MKQLDRLLFVQGGECFFCKKPLQKSDASVEHLVASANGGTNAEDNCVACCKTLNALLGSKSLKGKLEVFLRQKGVFRCPAETSGSLAPAPAPNATVTKLGPSAKRVPARSAAARPSLTAVPAATPVSCRRQGSTLRSVTCPTCKHNLPVAVGQVDYVCSHCGGAFRY